MCYWSKEWLAWICYYADRHSRSPEKMEATRIVSRWSRKQCRYYSQKVLHTPYSYTLCRLLTNGLNTVSGMTLNGQRNKMAIPTISHVKISILWNHILLLWQTLLYGNDGTLYKLKGKGPRFWSKADMEKKGFIGMSHDYYLVYELDTSCSHEYANIPGLKRGNQTTIPFFTTWSELMGWKKVVNWKTIFSIWKKRGVKYAKI